MAGLPARRMPQWETGRSGTGSYFDRDRDPADTVARLWPYLPQLGITIVEFFRQILPIMMMSWSNPGPDGLPEILSQENPPPLRVIVALTAFFENEMKAGRMRKRDPQVVARAYLGGLQSYVFFEVLLRRHRLASLSAENHVKALVDLLWQGLEPVKKKGSGK